MGQNTHNATDANFEQMVLNESLPVIVDYWAEWCGPCQRLGPLFEEVAAEYQGKVKFVKLDVDANQATAAKYSVRGIPTMIIYKDGTPVATKVGALSKSQLMAFIDGSV